MVLSSSSDSRACTNVLCSSTATNLQFTPSLSFCQSCHSASMVLAQVCGSHRFLFILTANTVEVKLRS